MSDLFCKICRRTYTDGETVCPECGEQLSYPTKSEHFIARVHLKNFSFEIIKVKRKNRGHLYFYPLDSEGILEQSETKFDSEVACQKDLYELINDRGEYLQRNVYENCFGFLENKFHEKYNVLKNMGELSDEDKIWWITYILLQYIRTPFFLKMADEISIQMHKFDKPIDLQVYHSISLFYAMPFSQNGAENNPLFTYLISKIKDFNFTVIKIQSRRLILSDNPVFITKTNNIKPDAEWYDVLFPVSPEIAICLRNPNFPRKRYCAMDINARIVQQSKELYSSYPITSKYVKCLRNHFRNEFY